MRFSRALQLAGWFKLFAMGALALGGMVAAYSLMGGEDDAALAAGVAFVGAVMVAGIAAFMAAVIEILVGIYEASETSGRTGPSD